jgi:hypothetical protein
MGAGTKDGGSRANFFKKIETNYQLSSSCVFFVASLLTNPHGNHDGNTFRAWGNPLGTPWEHDEPVL